MPCIRKSTTFLRQTAEAFKGWCQVAIGFQTQTSLDTFAVASYVTVKSLHQLTTASASQKRFRVCTHLVQATHKFCASPITSVNYDKKSVFWYSHKQDTWKSSFFFFCSPPFLYCLSHIPSSQLNRFLQHMSLPRHWHAEMFSKTYRC